MKAKILIVDDSAYVRTILKDKLLRNGYEVVGEAENGKEAIIMYDRVKPDIVAMDITMPEMGGIEALKAIKEAHPRARVVMISAMGQQEEVISAMRAGASEFFIKPIQCEKLVEALERTLK